MNCRNCGGAMEPAAGRGHLFCRYCGSFHFPPGVSDQGVRIVAESSEPRPCPTCGANLFASMLDDEHGVHYCGACRGVLLPRQTFAAVVQQRRSWTSDPPAPPVPLRRAELVRQVNCPQCSSRMDTHPYYGPGNVVMDSCQRCDAVWLDFGELGQIVDAPGRDRGDRARPSDRHAEPPPGPTPMRPSSGSAADRDDGLRYAGRMDLFDVLSSLFPR